MPDYFQQSYKILDSVLRGGKYSDIGIWESGAFSSRNKALIHRIVFGVLQNDILLDFQIKKFCTKSPKPAVALIIKISLYCIHSLSIPQYAAVSNALKYAQKTGKSALKPLINAVLQKSSEAGLLYPGTEDITHYYSVKYSVNPSLACLIVDAYGKDAERVFEGIYNSGGKDHIRPLKIDVNGKPDIKGLLHILKEKNIDAQETLTGVSVSLSRLYDTDIDKSKYTVMAYGSSLIAQSVVDTYKYYENQVSNYSPQVLDACAAPGGKSVYIAQTLKNCSVTACDIHAHRVKLIEDYSRRAGCSNITALKCDSAQYFAKFDSAFDIVLCDVPCSGIGTAHKKPEIKLNKTAIDITQLANQALEILVNCSRYVKPRGLLFYSTCTIMPQENDNAIQQFLNKFLFSADTAKGGRCFETIETKVPGANCKDGIYLRMVNGINADEGYFLAVFRRV